MSADERPEFCGAPAYIIEKHPEDFFASTRDAVNGRLLAGGRAGHVNVLKVKRKTVAIVVVHGIMASRLVDAVDTDKTIWDPDRKFFMLGFIKKSPEDRYNFIINRSRAVATQNKAPAKVSAKGVKERGWAGPSWTYYGKLIESLHNWGSGLKYFLDLPVYAYAYDWVRSNTESADGLLQFIEEKIQPQADKVIIVTHSMGGLAARYALGAAKNKDAVLPKILGVIHGAQPVHGAPTAYRRQLAGTEYASGFPFAWVVNFLSSNVMGGSGAAISAIFPHAAGALELLPNRHYRNNLGQGPWLHVEDLDEPGVFHSYPQDDPYSEIYAKSSNDVYWGMLREEWLQPKENVDKGRILESIDNAAAFHKRLAPSADAVYCHPRTLQIFSSAKHDTVTEVCWRAKDVTYSVKLQSGHYPDRRGASSSPRFKNLDIYRPAATGEYRQFRWRRLGEEATSPLDHNMRLSEIEKKLKADPNLRIYEFWLTKYGKVEKAVQDPATCLLGDGTVPLSSATALRPELSSWGGAALALPDYNGKPATAHVNKAEHAGFYDDAAIEAVKSGVYNLCLAWLRGELEE